MAENKTITNPDASKSTVTAPVADMAETKTITNPDASKSTVTAPVADVNRAPAKGDKVSVVIADGTLAPATITKLGRDKTVDLSFVYRGEEVVITGSPFDPTTKKCDSWSWPVETPPAA